MPLNSPASPNTAVRMIFLTTFAERALNAIVSLGVNAQPTSVPITPFSANAENLPSITWVGNDTLIMSAFNNPSVVTQDTSITLVDQSYTLKNSTLLNADYTTSSQTGAQITYNGAYAFACISTVGEYAAVTDVKMYQFDPYNMTNGAPLIQKNIPITNGTVTGGGSGACRISTTTQNIMVLVATPSGPQGMLLNATDITAPPAIPSAPISLNTGYGNLLRDSTNSSIFYTTEQTSPHVYRTTFAADITNANFTIVAKQKVEASPSSPLSNGYLVRPDVLFYRKTTTSVQTFVVVFNAAGLPGAPFNIDPSLATVSTLSGASIPHFSNNLIGVTYIGGGFANVQFFYVDTIAQTLRTVGTRVTLSAVTSTNFLNPATLGGNLSLRVCYNTGGTSKIFCFDAPTPQDLLIGQTHQVPPGGTNPQYKIPSAQAPALTQTFNPMDVLVFDTNATTTVLLTFDPSQLQIAALSGTVTLTVIAPGQVSVVGPASAMRNGVGVSLTTGTTTGGILTIAANGATKYLQVSHDGIQQTPYNPNAPTPPVTLPASIGLGVPLSLSANLECANIPAAPPEPAAASALCDREGDHPALSFSGLPELTVSQGSATIPTKVAGKFVTLGPRTYGVGITDGKNDAAYAGVSSSGSINVIPSLSMGTLAPLSGPAGSSIPVGSLNLQAATTTTAGVLAFSLPTGFGSFVADSTKLPLTVAFAQNTDTAGTLTATFRGPVSDINAFINAGGLTFKAADYSPGTFTVTATLKDEYAQLASGTASSTITAVPHPTQVVANCAPLSTVPTGRKVVITNVGQCFTTPDNLPIGLTQTGAAIAPVNGTANATAPAIPPAPTATFPLTLVNGAIAGTKDLSGTFGPALGTFTTTVTGSVRPGDAAVQSFTFSVISGMSATTKAQAFTPSALSYLPGTARPFSALDAFNAEAPQVTLLLETTAGTIASTSTPANTVPASASFSFTGSAAQVLSAAQNLVFTPTAINTCPPSSTTEVNIKTTVSSPYDNAQVFYTRLNCVLRDYSLRAGQEAVVPFGNALSQPITASFNGTSVTGPNAIDSNGFFKISPDGSSITLTPDPTKPGHLGNQTVLINGVAFRAAVEPQILFGALPLNKQLIFPSQRVIIPVTISTTSPDGKIKSLIVSAQGQGPLAKQASIVKIDVSGQGRRFQAKQNQDQTTAFAVPAGTINIGIVSTQLPNGQSLQGDVNLVVNADGAITTISTQLARVLRSPICTTLPEIQTRINKENCIDLSSICIPPFYGDALEFQTTGSKYIRADKTLGSLCVKSVVPQTTSYTLTSIYQLANLTSSVTLAGTFAVCDKRPGTGEMCSLNDTRGYWGPIGALIVFFTLVSMGLSYKYCGRTKKTPVYYDGDTAFITINGMRSNDIFKTYTVINGKKTKREIQWTLLQEQEGVSTYYATLPKLESKDGNAHFIVTCHTHFADKKTATKRKILTLELQQATNDAEKKLAQEERRGLMTPDEAILAQVRKDQEQIQSMLFQSASVSGRSSRRSSLAPSAAATDDEASQEDQYTQESAGISNMFGLLAGKKRKETGTLPKSSSSEYSPKEKTALPGQAAGGKK